MQISVMHIEQQDCLNRKCTEVRIKEYWEVGKLGRDSCDSLIRSESLSFNCLVLAI